jgi:putative membrane protein
MSLSDLPALNAGLNAMSAICLAVGFHQIRRQNVVAHRRSMVGALVFSALFLASYITYHSYLAFHLHAGPTVFRNPPAFRPIYLAILLTHTVLAVVIVPLVFLSLSRALKAQFDRHKKIARWTWPLWMYVSVTGVLIYLLLYRIFPQT